MCVRVFKNSGPVRGKVVNIHLTTTKISITVGVFVTLYDFYTCVRASDAVESGIESGIT